MLVFPRFFFSTECSKPCVYTCHVFVDVVIEVSAICVVVVVGLTVGVLATGTLVVEIILVAASLTIHCECIGIYVSVFFLSAVQSYCLFGFPCC